MSEWIWVGAALAAVGVAIVAWRGTRSTGSGRTAGAGGSDGGPREVTPAGAGAATEPAPTAAPAPGESRTPAAPPPLQQVVALALGDESASGSNPLGAADMQVLLGASQELARIGTETRYTPRRPSLLPQLLEAVGDEDASLRALSRIIAQDPALTGELLRTANSALYRVSGNPVESIERAAALLGTTGLRTLISAALVKPLAGQEAGTAAGRFAELTWEHSICSASAAEAWAARAQDCDPFTAHLLGLMHGLGDVAVFRVVQDALAARPSPSRAAVIAHALATQGAVTARRIAAGWGLSDRTQEALEAQSAAAPAIEVTPLARALRFGRLAGAVALLCRHQKMSEPQALRSLADGGFSGPQVERIWDRLVRAYVRP